jgi:fluoroacetyl-CoA thioesterase
MKETLKAGLTFDFQYTVPEDKTVPHLFPDIPEGGVMPEVLASGFMLGLIEFACIRALKPHLDWPEEQTVGIGFDLSHTAPTPPGFTVTVKGTLEKVEGRKLTFFIEAEDGIDPISKGKHERFVIDAKNFKASVAKKAQRISKETSR